MEAFATLASVAFASLAVLVLLVFPRFSDGECRSYLDIWAGENHLTLLRRQQIIWIPQTCDSPHRILYRLTVVDGQGRTLIGWAAVNCKFWNWLYSPRNVDVWWTGAREAPCAPIVRVREHEGSLFDHWLDG